MFLNRLSFTEKDAFLALAHHVARSDEHFSSEEELMIAKYCMEMQTDDIDYSEANFNLFKVLDVFESGEHRKIVILEIMALIYADGKVAKQEEDLLAAMIEHFGISPMAAIVYREWSKTIMSLFTQGEALLHL